LPCVTEQDREAAPLARGVKNGAGCDEPLSIITLRFAP